MSHHLAQSENSYACANCGWSWPKLPAGPCPGVRRYRDWQDVPEQLFSQAAMQRLALPRPELAAGCIATDRGYLYLYENTARRTMHDGGPYDSQLADAQRVTRWAHLLLQECGWRVLDIEVSSIEGQEGIISIALLDGTGRALLEASVRPSGSPGELIRRRHGLSPNMLRHELPFSVILPTLRAMIEERTVLLHDRQVLRALETEVRRLGQPALAAAWDFVGEEYARWNGDYCEQTGSYRIPPLPGGRHLAYEDCQAMIALVRLLAGDKRANSSAEHPGA